MRIGLHTQLAFLAALTSFACGPQLPPVDGLTTTQGGSGETGTEPSTGTDPGTTSPDPTDDPSAGPTSTSDPETFVPDVPNVPESCDPLYQDCPEGEKCVPYVSSGGDTFDNNRCVPVVGDQAAGEPCTYEGPDSGVDDCDANTMCWNIEDGPDGWVGTCHNFCGGTWDEPSCPEPGESCLVSGDSAVTLCIPGCDPLAQDCGEGLGCYWDGQMFACYFAAEVEPGQGCGFLNDCPLASFCVDSGYLPACEHFACCTPYCDIELGDAQCESVPGTVCVSFWDGEAEPKPGYETLGVCVAPQP